MMLDIARLQQDRATLLAQFEEYQRQAQQTAGAINYIDLLVAQLTKEASAPAAVAAPDEGADHGE